MKKSLVFFALVATVSAHASSVPAEWQARYRHIVKLYRSKDFAGLKLLVGDTFEWVQTDGKAMPKKEALAGMEPMFKSKKIAGDEKITSFYQKGDTVRIGFDLRLTITGADNKTFRYHEVGTDTWKRVGGKWLIFRTADKLVEQSQPK